MSGDSPDIKTAVVGASGYTGSELLRLLIMHPRVEIVGVTSREHAGKALTQVFPRFCKASAVDGLEFMMPDIDAIVATGAECVFLALPHGVAVEFAMPLVERGLRVIDLSADFRLRDAAVYEEFYGAVHPEPGALADAVYGLPEVHGEAIRDAKLVASPGCYPTSILIPLIPLFKDGLVVPDSIAVSSLSSASGAGKKASTDLLFVEVNESLRAYGAPKHRHLSEIEQELTSAAGEAVRISFVPHLMPVNAGIATTIFCNPQVGVDSVDVAAALENAYRDSAFVRLLGEGVFPDTKNVVRTNFVDVGWVFDDRCGRLILFSVEDNLGKGASSQGVQSFNLMFGLTETTGLENF
jgi:N-acetyl-gamma-glutamyl-phosphate reductase